MTERKVRQKDKTEEKVMMRKRETRKAKGARRKRKDIKRRESFMEHSVCRQLRFTDVTMDLNRKVQLSLLQSCWQLCEAVIRHRTAWS